MIHPSRRLVPRFFAPRFFAPRLFAPVALAIGMLAAPALSATDVPVIEIHIKDHRFQPDVIQLPAHQKVRLIVHNDDAEPEEFESEDFNSEKVIRPKSSATIFLPPMKPGEYTFWGEFHRDTAQGRAIVGGGHGPQR